MYVGIWQAWSCASLTHACLAAVRLFMQLLCHIWKMLYLYRHLLELGLKLSILSSKMILESGRRAHVIEMLFFYLSIVPFFIWELSVISYSLLVDGLLSIRLASKQVYKPFSWLAIHVKGIITRGISESKLRESRVSGQEAPFLHDFCFNSFVLTRLHPAMDCDLRVLRCPQSWFWSCVLITVMQPLTKTLSMFH